MLEGLRGEASIAELCRTEGINQNLYYRWSKEFLEAGKKRLAGDTLREASSEEAKGLRNEATQLKEVLAETLLENRLLKKAPSRLGQRDMRYRAAGKCEIIELVERSSWPVRRALAQLGIAKSTSYGWYERYRQGGDKALADTPPCPAH